MKTLEVPVIERRSPRLAERCKRIAGVGAALGTLTLAGGLAYAGVTGGATEVSTSYVAAPRAPLAVGDWSAAKTSLEVPPLGQAQADHYRQALVQVTTRPKPGQELATTHCQGTLVAPDQVLTASHCVRVMYDEQTGEPRGTEGTRGLISVEHQGTRTFATHETLYREYRQQPHSVAYDLARLTLRAATGGVSTALPLVGRAYQLHPGSILYSMLPDGQTIQGGVVVNMPSQPGQGADVLFKRSPAGSACAPQRSGTGVVTPEGIVAGVMAAQDVNLDGVTLSPALAEAFNLTPDSAGLTADLCLVRPPAEVMGLAAP